MARVRVVVLGNGVTSAERQCFGLLRALWPDACVARPDAPSEVALQHARLASVQLVRVAWPSASPAAALLRALPASLHALAGGWCAGVHVAAIAAAADAAARDGVLTLLVACGRDTVPAAAALRAAAPRSVVAVQLLHPRVRLTAFDVCLIPQHDVPRGGLPHSTSASIPQHDVPRGVPPASRSVHLTLGALHDLDAAGLAAARTQWQRELGATPRPLVACLVGGPTRNCSLDCDALARQLAAVAAAVHAAGGSTWFCTSRRTPPRLASALRWAAMGVQRCVFVPPCVDATRNPYPGLLAWADTLLVTADSVSMLSEAAATEAPGVYVVGAAGARSKVQRFLTALLASGAAWPLQHPAQVATVQPQRRRLLEAASAAAAVNEALAARSAAFTDASRTNNPV